MIDMSMFGNEPAPGYKGPVRWVYPGCEYGESRSAMFCPRCGSTEVGMTGKDGRSGVEAYRCSACGAGFKLAENRRVAGKRFSIRCDGEGMYGEVTRDDVEDALYDDLLESQGYGDDRYYKLASSYYGEAYDDLRSYDSDDDDEGSRMMSLMELDVPFAEAGHVISHGYIDGMDVGDEVRLPGTPVSIVRTKNTKKRKDRRWLR